MGRFFGVCVVGGGFVEEMVKYAERKNDDLRHFEGLILNLQKRRVGEFMEESKDCDFLLFGYYDYLSIRNTDTWFDFSPIQSETSASPEPFFDRYPIKLLYPPKNCRRNMENIGFTFAPWQRGSEWDTEENNRRFPLMAMIQFNVTDRFLNQYKTPQACLRAMANGIKSAAKDNAGFRTNSEFDKRRFQRLNCGLFQAIGSQDYVLLCRAEAWDDVFKLVDAMHAWQLPDENGRKGFAISNIYLTPGLVAVNLAEAGIDVGGSGDLEVVIRLTLQSGKSMQEFGEAFWEAYGKKSADKIAFSVLHGRYDGAMTSTLPIGETLRLLTPGGLFHPSSQLFKKYLMDTNSSIRIRLESTPVDEGEQDRKSPERDGTAPEVRYAERIAALENRVGEYERFLQENNLNIRQVRAMRELLLLFSNLSESLHSNGICSILLDAIESLQKNISHYIACYKNEQDPEERREWIAEIDEGIDAFREYVGNYLISLAQAERMFVEGLKLRHQSIASATKLLFGYNQIIRTLTDITCRDKARFSYSFVVVSGGCDETSAHNLFPYIVEPDEDGKYTENRLLVIQMSEMSVFNLQGSLFRLIHEAWHYCGDRLRAERSAAWADSFSYSVGGTIAAVAFLEPLAFSWLYQDCIDYGLTELAEQMDELFERERAAFGKAVAERLQAYFKEPWPDHTAKPFYSAAELYREPYWRDAHDALLQWLHPALTGERKWGRGVEDILRLQYAHQASLLRSVVDAVMAEGKKAGAYSAAKRLNVQALWMSIESLEMFEANVARAKKVEDFLNLCVASLSGYPVDSDCFSEIDTENIDELNEILQSFDIDFHCVLISEAYKEAFSDYMACYTLKASAADYILGMVYETWDIDISLSPQRLSALRMGSVLEAYYGIDGDKLPEESRELLREKYRCLCENCPWYKSRVDVDELCERIDWMLKSCCDFRKQGVSKPLVQYLKQCGEAFDRHIGQESNRKEQLTGIRKTFEDTGHITDIGKDSHDRVIGGVNAILQYWIDLNHAKEDDRC